MIDNNGPITFKHLSDRIARAHGFQRTGRQISSTVSAACRRSRQYVATPGGDKVFWPEGRQPKRLLPYRGLTINGERREWRDVPYPGKLWLIRKIVDDGSDDPVRSVAREIGITRVKTQFRTEIAEIVRHLERD